MNFHRSQSRVLFYCVFLVPIDAIFPSPYAKEESEEYKKSFEDFESSINKAFEKFCKENKIESDMWIYERIYHFPDKKREN